jgi:hypothetical protein
MRNGGVDGSCSASRAVVWSAAESTARVLFRVAAESPVLMSGRLLFVDQGEGKLCPGDGF